MTRLFGILGHPIAHSRSPAMHAAALRALRADAQYAAFDVPPSFLRPVLRALILAGVEGLNVTVPLKEAVLPLMDRLDASAEATGAVNTIVIRHGRTVGYNTDGIGFRRALQELAPRLRPCHAVLLGAGGAARAVAWELTRTPGIHLTIANRHPARATRLVRWLAARRRSARLCPASLRQVRLDMCDLLVNTTSVGLHAGDGCPINPAMLRRGMAVYDLIYHRETALVAAARRRGCVAAGGDSMLLYQGAESLRLWLHRHPPIEVMRRALHREIRSEI